MLFDDVTGDAEFSFVARVDFIRNIIIQLVMIRTSDLSDWLCLW